MQKTKTFITQLQTGWVLAFFWETCYDTFGMGMGFKTVHKTTPDGMSALMLPGRMFRHFTVAVTEWGAKTFIKQLQTGCLL
jgi:hypothetical protein